MGFYHSLTYNKPRRFPQTQPVTPLNLLPVLSGRLNPQEFPVALTSPSPPFPLYDTPIISHGMAEIHKERMGLQISGIFCKPTLSAIVKLNCESEKINMKNQLHPGRWQTQLRAAGKPPECGSKFQTIYPRIMPRGWLLPKRACLRYPSGRAQAQGSNPRK